MSLCSLTGLFPGCGGENPSEERRAFSEEAEMREVLENMMEREIPAKTPLISPRERALVATVSLTVQQSEVLLAETVGRIIDRKTLSPEEILEAVYQCAPYSGISRAADASKIAHGVFRKKGVHVQKERQTTDGTVDDRFSKGVGAQVALFGERFEAIRKMGPDKVPLSNYFLATNCFGDYYTRKGLDLSTRELLTMVILVNLGVEEQLKAHIQANLSGGRSPEYLEQSIYTALPFCGYPRMLNALRYLKEATEMALGDGKESLANAEKIFSRGEENPFGKYFKGRSYLQMLNQDAVPVGNVTFEPGCRNKWHVHRGGAQLLIATAGEGFLQIEGKNAQKLKPGDVVLVPQGVKHWHGASKDSWFAHLSVEIPDPLLKGGGTEWFEDVDDKEYNAL